MGDMNAQMERRPQISCRRKAEYTVEKPRCAPQHSLNLFSADELAEKVETGTV